MYHVLLAVQCINGWGNERSEDWDGKEGSENSEGEWRSPGILSQVGGKMQVSS